MSYLELFRPDALQTVGYRIGVWSWILLFEVPVLCLPVSWYSFKTYLARKKEILAENN